MVLSGCRCHFLQDSFPLVYIPMYVNRSTTSTVVRGRHVSYEAPLPNPLRSIPYSLTVAILLYLSTRKRRLAWVDATGRICGSVCRSSAVGCRFMEFGRRVWAAGNIESCYPASSSRAAKLQERRRCIYESSSVTTTKPDDGDGGSGCVDCIQ
jgi:hypothetical protein